MKAIFFFLAAGLSIPAMAQDGSALQRCRAIGEAGARLACYDAIPLAAAQAAAAPAAAAVPAAAAAPVATATAAVAVAAPPPAQAQAQFGLAKPASQAESEQIESMITGLFEGWDPRSIIKLANGQVWQIDDGSTAAYALQSPKVKIRRTALGAYYLEIEGAKRAPRVKRLQ